jgi:hypothetical protein
MTINRLHKLLAGAITKGYGHRMVCIQKNTFEHPLEEVEILEVEEAIIATWPMLDDDGGHRELADGRESTRTGMLLKGDHTPI